MLNVRCPHCQTAFIAFADYGRPDDEASCPRCRWNLNREQWEENRIGPGFYERRKAPRPEPIELEDDWAEVGFVDSFGDYAHGER